MRSCSVHSVYKYHPWPLGARSPFPPPPPIGTTRNASGHCLVCPLGTRIAFSWEPLVEVILKELEKWYNFMTKKLVTFYLVWRKARMSEWGCPFLLHQRKSCVSPLPPPPAGWHGAAWFVSGHWNIPDHWLAMERMGGIRTVCKDGWGCFDLIFFFWSPGLISFLIMSVDPLKHGL